MTMSDTTAETNPCACGCGELVRGTWKRGHAARGPGGYDPDRHSEPVAPPSDDGADDWDIGDADPEPEFTPPPPWTGPRLAEDVPPMPPMEPDEPPAVIGKGKPRTIKGKPVRVTAAVEKDIDGKVGLILTMTGSVWQARDPVCGGTFLGTEPNIRDAAVKLIVQSPDLVAWFTGTGGGFMLWLNLIMACQPVLMVIWAHHITHSITGPDEQNQPQRQYAA